MCKNAPVPKNAIGRNRHPTHVEAVWHLHSKKGQAKKNENAKRSKRSRRGLQKGDKVDGGTDRRKELFKSPTEIGSRSFYWSFHCFKALSILELINAFNLVLPKVSRSMAW